MHHLEFDNVSKSFPGVRALTDVSFRVDGGGVRALMGENGAGKSTLLKILAGVHRPDAGSVRVDGQAVAFRNTSEALNGGVAVIYQELQLVPELSVADNLYLGHLPNTGGWIHRRDLLAKARQQMLALGETDIDPRAKVGSLPIAQRQMVEIGKALTRDARVIAFDEPTSSLSEREVERLFAVINALKSEGRVILYVSHRMDEIYRICDSATVLRDGKHVETFPTLAGTSTSVLVSRMVGRPIEDVFRYRPRPIGGPALEVDGLLGPGLSKPTSFRVNAGEVLGIFGLVGAGRTELLKLIFGATRATEGSIRVRSNPANVRSPRDAIRAGIVLCPEDRKGEGIVPGRSVMENLNLAARDRLARLGFIIDPRRERENADRYVRQLGIKTPSLGQAIVNLSGGNQQKVILSRWLGSDIRVALLDEPTRGIDVGAKAEIYSIIYDLAAAGVGVVVVSSEMHEVLGVCDRLLVMRQGAIAGELSRPEATPERVLHMALPVSPSPSAADLQEVSG